MESMRPILYCNRSSPARGTWIEIAEAIKQLLKPGVVPRKGDVDRNLPPDVALSCTHVSSPARGTWIEISMVLQTA